MNRTIRILGICAIMALSGLTMVNAQEGPQPQRDTVNMDTDAVPTFYYNTEDENAGAAKEKNSTGIIAIIIGAVVVAGAVAFFLLRKKK